MEAAAATGSRRKFVVGGLVTVAAVGLAGCGGGGGSGTVNLPPTTGTTPPADGAKLVAGEADLWEAMIGSSFSIAAESGQLSAKLLSVARATDAARPTTLNRKTGFVALFELAGGTPPVGSNTYQISHATRGNFGLFLGQPSNVMNKNVIAAVFN